MAERPTSKVSVGGQVERSEIKAGITAHCPRPTHSHAYLARPARVTGQLQRARPTTWCPHWSGDFHVTTCLRGRDPHIALTDQSGRSDGGRGRGVKVALEALRASIKGRIKFSSPHRLPFPLSHPLTNYLGVKLQLSPIGHSRGL